MSGCDVRITQRVALPAFAIALVAAMLVSCSSSSPAAKDASHSASSGSSSTSAGCVGDSLGGDPALGISVPDAFTSLVLTPVGRSTFPFRGSDGKYHVAYDLAILNTSAFPATLDKL